MSGHDQRSAGDLTNLLEELLAEPLRELPVLLKSRGVTVARLYLQGTDFPWIDYRFEPYPEWQELGPATEIFSKGTGRGLEKGLEVIAARVQAIEDLDLWLVSEDGSVAVGDFLFSIRDNQLLVRSYPRGASPHQPDPQ